MLGLRSAPRRSEILVGTDRRPRDYYLRRMLLAADLLGVILAIVLAFALASQRASPVSDALLALPALVLWALILRSYRLYDNRMRRIDSGALDDLGPLFHAVVLGVLATWLLYRVVAPDKRPVLEELVLFGLLSLLLICSLRQVATRAHLELQGPERVLLACCSDTICQLRDKVARHPEYGMEITDEISTDAGGSRPEGGPRGAPGELEDSVTRGGFDHLLLQIGGQIRGEDAVRLMRLCHVNRVRFSVVPERRHLLNPGAEIDRVEGLGILVYDPPVLSRSSSFLKRSLDVAISAPALLVVSPLWPLIALAIKLDSPGPVFFSQVRVGRRGRRFRLLKFRTMRVDAERQVEALMQRSSDPDWLILDEDPRITRVGRLLRRTSLDETPQLWNVLRGEMSIVGPRPLPERDDHRVAGWARSRLDMRPGLTGPWQVMGRSDIPFREMLEIDYDYASGWSLWNDIKLILRTVPAVLLRRGSN